MSVLYVVFPVAMVLAVVFIALFIRATRQGQWDDLKTPAVRAVHDDDPVDRQTAATSRPDGPGPPPAVS